MLAELLQEYVMIRCRQVKPIRLRISFCNISMFGEQVNTKIDELYKHKCRVVVLANKLDVISRKIIIYRYICFKDWKYISNKINKPISTTRGRLHERAINEIEQLFFNNKTQYIVYFLKNT